MITLPLRTEKLKWRDQTRYFIKLLAYTEDIVCDNLVGDPEVLKIVITDLEAGLTKFIYKEIFEELNTLSMSLSCGEDCQQQLRDIIQKSRVKVIVN